MVWKHTNITIIQWFFDVWPAWSIWISQGVQAIPTCSSSLLPPIPYIFAELTVFLYFLELSSVLLVDLANLKKIARKAYNHPGWKFPCLFVHLPFSISGPPGVRTDAQTTWRKCSLSCLWLQCMCHSKMNEQWAPSNHYSAFRISLPGGDQVTDSFFPSSLDKVQW